MILFIFLFLCLRIIPIWGGNFPFQYDNAKDSLVMLEMFQYHKPALLGPTTSLPGLFYGPAWYYIALPFNILGKFHPAASVAMVIVLGTITMWFTYKYLGKFAAFLYTVSLSVIASQQTAWTPYMTSFPMTWSLLVLYNTKPKEQIATRKLCLLAFFASLMFHFEVAYAVVFLPLILIILIVMNIRTTWKQWLLAFCVFCSLLIPQAIFELRHDFFQTRSVLKFIQTYKTSQTAVQENQKGIARIFEVAIYIYDNANGSIRPIEWRYFSVPFLLLMIFYLTRKQAKIDRYIALPFILGTFVFYCFLPIKPFYLAALTSLWIILCARSLRTLFPRLVLPIVIVFSICCIVTCHISFLHYQKLQKTERILYSSRAQAIEQAYLFSEGKPFASYQFVPEVYDYTYQLLYLRQSLLHKNLPTEFSYKPGEFTYMQTKHISPSAVKPEYIILITEESTDPKLFHEWWNTITQNIESFVEEKNINDVITVYKTIPKL